MNGKMVLSRKNMKWEKWKWLLHSHAREKYGELPRKHDVGQRNMKELLPLTTNMKRRREKFRNFGRGNRESAKCSGLPVAIFNLHSYRWKSWPRLQQNSMAVFEIRIKMSSFFKLFPQNKYVVTFYWTWIVQLGSSTCLLPGSQMPR